jgi:predicted DNA-binding ribbon-helix-helix protein
MDDDPRREDDPSEPRRRSFRLSGHRTSLSLERAFWDALKDIAQQQDRSMTSIIEEVDDTRTGSLTPAVRVYILEWLRRY